MNWEKYVAVAALALSVVSFFRDELRERFGRVARLEVWLRMTHNLSTHAPAPPNDVTLIFRNLSPRPTAVLDVYFRESGGGVIGGRGYGGRIPLPLKLEGWGVAEVTFPVNAADEARAVDIQVTDLDGDTVIVPQGPGRAGWHRVRSR